MPSSAADPRPAGPARSGPGPGCRAGDDDRARSRINAAIRLLMQVRTLMASITLLVLAVRGLAFATFVMVACVALLSWLASRHVDRIVPRLLDHPLLVALDLCLGFAVLAVGGPSGPFFLSTVATAAVAGLLYRWPGMLIVSVAQIAGYFAAFAVPHDDLGTFQALASQPAYYPVIGFGGVALRRLLEEHGAAEDARVAAEATAAAAEERARLAREMHDSLAKTLRGLALGAAALPAWVRTAPDRAEREAARLAEAAETASREARGLLTELRDTAAALPLPDAVRAGCDAWSARTGVAVQADIAGDVRLPHRSRHELLAILGEALANVERHADAANVSVRLAWSAADIVLTVRDDGRGFRTAAPDEHARRGRYGLVGLYERAERAGGTALVRSEPGEGTTLVVRVAAGPAGSAGSAGRAGPDRSAEVC
ncbi:hypothetical protein HUT06_09135 [Actinomadura sp. NAK00032]|uniref:sensor histidine kinase n=1 Tax=Actinomadura sp. NAK00032 TaxID=2742128 RepID=UPI001592072E|nr:sensor histidine kinase [Actinomadura sp. NAK00032]QKW34165.1 hypothetical protein HUT06_09135 [Actinomadura sp. NAK00032]